ncbi:LPS export ABC transporter periplasmic protein LptC [Rhodocytophaga rosea]|uniref:LPS export ABC transporter periplasmic protein LptC n=1 Tax=Rhodocytophaga rosea TaxID=2704465 RepID=A0A6C0GLM6_9BACT|nr:LPS export ABC transporter periplasmic protein LptC [Rhodocytophaga rosea]QHT68540.1 LPS export ABC transporter periplasmic protein LptC [Rhodocytophaga rosea]
MLLLACKGDDKDLQAIKPYTGPKLVSENIRHTYTDSAKIKMYMAAPREEIMDNGDKIWPKGVYIEFYNENQIRTTTLRANSGVFYQEKNQYTVTGNVVIIDSVKTQKMNTEELHWTPKTQKIFTDKFVVIQTKSDTLKGQGLEANQDFSRWKILKPTGTLPLSQQ